VTPVTGSTSLKLKVELETTDTGEVKSVNSFVDSGATGEFIDHHYAKSNRLHTLGSSLNPFWFTMLTEL